MIHDRHGWWLADAGPVAPRPPLAGDARADVVVIGGGYTGMWAAWSLADAGCDVVLLEADVCGHGPSGRNGGFVESFWGQLPELRRRYGDAGARAIQDAGAESVPAIGAWCEEEAVDAAYRQGGYMRVSTAPAQDGAWDEPVRACRELGLANELIPLDGDAVRARCASPLFRGGVLAPGGASVHPAKLALGLRRRLIERGVPVHEHSRVRRLAEGDDVLVEAGSGRVRARSAVLALNAAAAGVGPLRRRLTAAASHIVLTEPVPDVLDELGWAGGECITDCRTFLHYFRTTPDHRVLFGYAGGRIAYGARLGGRIQVDPWAVAQAQRDLVRILPSLSGRRIEHAWGGPIDVSPTHLPIIGTLPGGRAHYAFGFTGNGVGPSHLAGRILASLALDRRDGLTRLALVDPPAVTVPPEPLRWAGGAVVRQAFLRAEAREDEGRRPDPVSGFVRDLPRRLGIHIGR